MQFTNDMYKKKQKTVIRKKEKTVIAQRNCEYVFVSPPAREWGSRVTSLVPKKCKAVLMYYHFCLRWNEILDV